MPWRLFFRGTGLQAALPWGPQVHLGHHVLSLIPMPRTPIGPACAHSRQTWHYLLVSLRTWPQGSPAALTSALSPRASPFRCPWSRYVREALTCYLWASWLESPAHVPNPQSTHFPLIFWNSYMWARLLNSSLQNGTLEFRHTYWVVES